MFTRVPAYTFAKSLYDPFGHSASVHFVTSINRHGCYQPKPQLLGGVRTH